jgi:hemerythrin
MTLLEWKPEYSVGNFSVDFEHQQMISHINELGEQLGGLVSIETIETALGQIHADISAHFALEERLMREAGYGEYEDHKEDHEELLDQIVGLMDNFAWNPDTGREMLRKKLSGWFGHHFATFDARLHRKLG